MGKISKAIGAVLGAGSLAGAAGVIATALGVDPEVVALIVGAVGAGGAGAGAYVAPKNEEPVEYEDADLYFVDRDKDELEPYGKHAAPEVCKACPDKQCDSCPFAA